MKTSKYYIFSILCIALCTLTSCKDWLTAPEPGAVKLENFFTSEDAARQCINGCYVPLMWEFNRTYFCEWFIGDVVSDDALKGGQNTSDMGAAYDMENWKTTARNELLHDFYQAQYLGIGRCNIAIKYISEMSVDTAFTDAKKTEMLAEAHFLRAFYYFRLVRVFAGTPLVLEVLDNSSKWQQPRASVQSVYDQVIADLLIAQKSLPTANQVAASNIGRATKGAAQAMLQKVNLYMASPYWNAYLSGTTQEYAKSAKAWGDSIISSGQYALVSDYASQFALAGENSTESVFEIQYAEVAWGDYGEGFGYTAGSFTQRLVRSRSSQISDGDAGWGFDHPTHNLYNEFEAGDARRDVAILDPNPALMDNPTEEIYLGSAYLNNKYGWYGNRIAHDSRGPLNNKQIRYADVLLMQAEACILAGEGDATQYLNEVRSRAGLGNYGTYAYSTTTPSSGDPLMDAVRHERRVELAMEGHRWFDLVRWFGGNGLDTYMNVTYPASETDDAKAQMGTFRAGVHEIFPIPIDEIELNPMEQNSGYN